MSLLALVLERIIIPVMTCNNLGLCLDEERCLPNFSIINAVVDGTDASTMPDSLWTPFGLTT